MTRTHTRLWVGGSSVACLAALALLLPEPGHGQEVKTAAPKTSNVLVVNTAAQAVPTTAQGTTSVSGNVGITGTANVNVTNAQPIAVGGTVSVGNTPDVNIANTPTVTVGNAAVTIDQDAPARNRVLYSYGWTLGDGSASKSIDVTFAPGRTFVIEEVSARSQLPGSQYPSIHLDVGSIPARFFFKNEFTGPFSNSAFFWTTSEQARIYIRADDSPKLVLERFPAATGLASYQVSWSGYYAQ